MSFLLVGLFFKKPLDFHCNYIYFYEHMNECEEYESHMAMNIITLVQCTGDRARTSARQECADTIAHQNGQRLTKEDCRVHFLCTLCFHIPNRYHIM